MVNLENTEGLEASGSQSWLHIRVPRGVLKKNPDAQAALEDNEIGISGDGTKPF